jgi:serine/threonine-protein kinase
MGQVWKASDLHLHDRPVAVKRIHPHLISASDALARFQREVEALAGLSHPYIVGVLDSGRDEEGCYCVMEYAHGATLRAWLGRHEPPEWPPYRDVLTIFTQVCRAVAFAHSRGIIHRDLKPENVVIAPDRAVQILDFGLASCVSEEGITLAGKVVGTPLYMAPEQIRGGQPDPRWDVYALGVVLFEMLTLRRPFEGDNWLDVARRREEEPPPGPRRYREDLPDGIETVIRKALSRDAEARYESPRGLVGHVQKVLTAALPTRHTPDNERVLRQLAQAAWLDGVVTDREREFLLERAKELGLPRERAREIVSAAQPQHARSGDP